MRARMRAFQFRHQTGLVTMVFTDVEGSTRMKQELGDERALHLLREHHMLLRLVLDRYPEAEEINTAGDSFFLIFLRPSDAVQYCLEVQEEMRQLRTGMRKPLRVRMGIHVGEVYIDEHGQMGQDKDLYGIQVDTCARVMGLAVGGQILMTRVAYDNSRQVLKGPSGGGVKHLEWRVHGTYQLKGIEEVVEICEVGRRGRAPLKAPLDSEKARRKALQAEPPRATRQLALINAFICMLAGWMLLVLPIDFGLKALSYDVPFLLWEAPNPDEVVVVFMDEESYGRLEQRPDALWDRRLHGRLVERLREFGAKTIVLDLLMADPWEDPKVDKQFAEILGERADVVLAASVDYIATAGQPERTSFRRAVEPIGSAARWGVVELPQERDQVVRRHHWDLHYPGLAWVAADVAGAGLQDPGTKRWMLFYGTQKALPNVSYYQVLEPNAINPRVFKDKVVFVGQAPKITLQGGRSGDQYATPFTRWTGFLTPGVELQATACLNLLRREWLIELSPFSELILLAATGLSIGFGLIWGRTRLVILLGIGIFILMLDLGVMLVWKYHYWFPWMIAGGAQVLVAMLGRNFLLARQKGRLREAEPATTPREDLSEPEPEPEPELEPELEPEPPAGEPDYTAARRDLPGSDRGRLAVESSPPRIPDLALIRRIGRGAYGEVWLARNVIAEYQAVKIVFRRAFENERPYEREFFGMQKFTPISRSHAGLLQVRHIGRNEASGFFYYVMELADDWRTGVTIDPEMYCPRTLARDIESRSEIPIVECIQVGMELTAALEFLHGHQLIHRDIKPGNIIFVNGRPKLADVGLVVEIRGDTDPVSWVGTTGYIPPEGPGTPAADVFSLGKVLYSMATGRTVTSFPELPSRLGARADHGSFLKFNTLLLRACEPDVRGRIATAAEFHAGLERLQNELSANPS